MLGSIEAEEGVLGLCLWGKERMFSPEIQHPAASALQAGTGSMSPSSSAAALGLKGDAGSLQPPSLG